MLNTFYGDVAVLVAYAWSEAGYVGDILYGTFPVTLAR